MQNTKLPTVREKRTDELPADTDKKFNHRFFVVTEELPEKDYFSVMPRPLEIKQYIATDLSTYKQELIEKIESRKVAWLKANEHEFYGKGMIGQIQDVVIKIFAADLINHIKGVEGRMNVWVEKLICKIFGHKKQEIIRVSWDEWELFDYKNYPFLGRCLRCGNHIKGEHHD